MKKKTISRLFIILFIFNIYGYHVQATPNNYLKTTPQIDKSSAKLKIMSNFKNNNGKIKFKEGEILVKAKISSIETIEKKYSVKSQNNLNKQVDIVKFDNNKYSMEEMLLNLNNDLNIEYAEPNYVSKLFDLPENEPGFSDMWGLNNIISSGIDINVKTAWGINTGSPDVVVGVIDTGIDYNHEDLKENIWINGSETPNNGIDDDNNGYVDDYNGWDFADMDNDLYDDHGHGTHVSGIIAASSNGIGIVGVAPTIKIMPMKAADLQGNMYTSDIINAIQYGASKGVKLFNCSFGGDAFSQAQYDVMKNTDALFMCAAGNGDINGNGLDNDSYVKSYPASFDLPNIISVASMDKYGYLSTFSNYGQVSVDIAAPGSSILSTVPGGYGYKNGTSMATPYVTGVAALVLSVNMDLSSIEVKNCILKSTHKLPQLEDKIATGAIVDAYGAMAVAKPSIVVNITDVDDNGTTDIMDLALIGVAYNSRIGESKYKRILDINNDSIVDIYDLVLLSKAIQ
ncbi:S8 family serine peptidase [Clostridium sp.]|uniref:S8 family serine peptidase n=1 Tax=Clostridium sp. TaxID=1506 RepID=UPI001A3CD938|nr:S8 family serine peptidase [Clostridium sp.]MBK5240656.1 S8 family serine peptidase [Clostridium sp.]